MIQELPEAGNPKKNVRFLPAWKNDAVNFDGFDEDQATKLAENFKLAYLVGSTQLGKRRILLGNLLWNKAPDIKIRKLNGKNGTKDTRTG